jgi:hypothetical protein
MGSINTPLSPIDRSFKQKDSKENSKLVDMIDPMDLTDIYRVFYPGQ